MREMIARLLAPEYDIVGTASNGSEAVDSVAELRPDVVLLDISMPGMTGIEVARRLQSLGSAPKVLFLSQYAEEDIVNAAIDTGASGYVTKLCAAEELIPALRAISSGKTYWPASVASRVRPPE
jgi:DNA-binding NarL/FixJ family response regulator